MVGLFYELTYCYYGRRPFSTTTFVFLSPNKKETLTVDSAGGLLRCLHANPVASFSLSFGTIHLEFYMA